ncbi:MAG: hypothetical protein L3J96_00345 [Thermoplasmata archaeon]|nr:hypothetical protein [Thermoplasmata archaeon]
MSHRSGQPVGATTRAPERPPDLSLLVSTGLAEAAAAIVARAAEIRRANPVTPEK